MKDTIDEIEFPIISNISIEDYAVEKPKPIERTKMPVSIPKRIVPVYKPRTLAPGKTLPGVNHNLGGYQRGCRCTVCRQARSDHRKKRWLEVKAGLRVVPSHGLTGYRSGCRCPVCTKLTMEHKRQKRKERDGRRGAENSY